MLAGISTLVAALLAVPLAFLLIEAAGAGSGQVFHLVFRQLTADLLWNTIRLTVVVTALCAVIGTAAAWCVERTSLPGRRIWAVLVVVPLAIPDFVVSFGWASLWTWVQGFRGAVIVLTLAVYPLVYLPVAASLRSADPGQEEVARSLGAGRARTFVRITLGQARGAILGGCLLVALVLLAEYGAFEILGYQTFTTMIFTEFSVSFNLPAACALSLVLVLLSLLVLAGEGMLRGSGRIGRPGPQAARQLPPHRLGRATVPVLAGFALLVGLALGVPVASSIYWMLEGGAHALAGVSLAAAAAHTAGYGVGAATADTLLALPVALLAIRFPSRARLLLERSTYLVLAMPGVVAAFALSYFTERYGAGFLYQSTAPARAVLRDHVLPAGPGRRQSVAGPGPGQPGRDRPVAGPAAAGRLVAGHPPARRAGPGRRVLPGLPDRGYRAHGHTAAHTDRRADPRHPVLGVRELTFPMARRPRSRW